MDFVFSFNIILEDDLVLLRPLQESDVENLLKKLKKKSSFNKYLRNNRLQFGI